MKIQIPEEHTETLPATKTEPPTENNPEQSERPRTPDPEPQEDEDKLKHEEQQEPSLQEVITSLRFGDSLFFSLTSCGL